MIDVILFFSSLNGRCLGNQFYGKIGKPTFILTVAFQNGLEYRNFDLRILMAMIQLYIMYKFDEVWSSNLGDEF